jgi:hypothetical protein
VVEGQSKEGLHPGRSPHALGGRPLGVAFQSPLRRAGFSCHISSNFFVLAVKSIRYIVGCFPHTYFLLSFI